MMIFTKKEINQSSSIHQKIRKASFVPIEEPVNEKFKYEIVNNVRQRLRKLLKIIKDSLIKNYQRAILKAPKFDWKLIGEDASSWLFEALIEGVTANFVTYFLFSVPFNIGTIFAHGIFIKQGISVYWRLKHQNGSNTKLPKKND